MTQAAPLNKDSNRISGLSEYLARTDTETQHRFRQTDTGKKIHFFEDYQESETYADRYLEYVASQQVDDFRPSSETLEKPREGVNRGYVPVTHHRDGSAEAVESYSTKRHVQHE